MNIRVDRKEGIAQLVCKVCDQRYQSKVNRTWSFVLSVAQLNVKLLDLTEPIDIYSEWIDAADAAQNDPAPRRPVASSSRAVAQAGSDED